MGSWDRLKLEKVMIIRYGLVQLFGSLHKMSLTEGREHAGTYTYKKYGKVKLQGFFVRDSNGS